MKNLLVIFLVCLSFQTYAQKYKVEKGSVHFFSEAPLENIEATNSELLGIVDESTDKFVFRVQMTGFKFEKALMEEHFNENYVESEKFPKAEFRGEIMGNYSFEEEGEHQVKAIGELSLHGVSRKIEIDVLIKNKNGEKSFEALFPISLADYNIEIPSIVFQNIAEVVEVTIKGTMILVE